MGDELKFGKLNIICNNIINNPFCPHGPTLLYERIKLDGTNSKFYACSAYKNRKDCSFYKEYDEILNNKKNIKIKEKKKISTIKKRLKDDSEKIVKIKKNIASNRSYCHTCTDLLLPEELSYHKLHDVCQSVTDFQMNHPSQLLYLRTNSKGESQFMFTKKSVDIIIDGFKRCNISKVLCVGTPSIYERLLDNEPGISSLFLDIDHRYRTFYDDTQFCWFNMMNFHFFDSKALDKVKRFLRSPDSVLILDPPFSAREEPLAYTLSQFNSMFKFFNQDKILPVIWIFPYFKESDVLSSYPGMVMLDYDVTYVNQKQFKEGSKTSVVRIFTNLDPSKFVLPTKEGYHFCLTCNRWVSKLNKHCFKCFTCPSKNGHPYKHCDICSRCVKNYWIHCEKCGRCALKDHPCDLWQENNRELSKKRKALQTNSKNAIKKFKKEGKIRKKCFKKNRNVNFVILPNK